MDESKTVTATLDQADEEILTDTASDQALEAAAETCLCSVGTSSGGGC
jgi:hypothetical protein